MKKNLLLLFTSIAFITVKAQTGFHQQSNTAYSFHVFNQDSVYMVTTNKSIMMINPQTKEWKYINSYNLPGYGSLVLKNKNTGAFLTPSTGSVVTTTDGWLTTNTSTVYLNYLNQSPSGYYGFNKLGSSSYTLQFSPDGVTWNMVQPAGSILAMRNYGNKIYVLGGSSQSYVSTNGGQTYSTVTTTGTFTGSLAGFHMASADTFIVLMTNTLCKSYNGGATWTNTPLPQSITYAAFKNKNEFAIQPTGGTATFSYTQDGGNTWSVCATAPPPNSGGILTYIGNDIHFFPGNRTSDYGTTWEQILPVFPIAEFDVHHNPNCNILLSGRSTGKYSYSVNKGRSFPSFTNTINSNEDMMAVKVLNNGTFLGGDRKGQVYISSNNGQSWTKKYNETGNWNSIRFSVSSDESKIVLGRAAQPIVSIDGGATFSLVSMGGGNHIQTVKPDGTMLDLAETSGWDLRKFDIMGGTTVVATYSPSLGSEYIAAIKMVDDNVGYIVTCEPTTKKNKIYRTSDGWTTYTTKTDILPVTSGTAAYTGNVVLGNIAFVHTFGTDTVIITGNNNAYYHQSNDGGTTWNTIVPAFVPNKIYRMHFFTSNSYIAITTLTSSSTAKAVYLNTQGGGSGGPIGINEISTKDSQNHLVIYPNPGKSGDKITILDLKENAQVNIVDINGRTIQSLQAGTNSFSIDHLSTGLYFVQVKERNKHVRTAKLIVH